MSERNRQCLKIRRGCYHEANANNIGYRLNASGRALTSSNVYRKLPTLAVGNNYQRACAQ